MWGDRRQDYRWANEIEYDYRDSKNVLHRLKLHVVICDESWTEDHSRSTERQKSVSTRYAWLSSTPLNQSNVFDRCTKIGRYRWNIENNILTEKHQAIPMSIAIPIRGRYGGVSLSDEDWSFS
jgi:hypothetical protein